MNEHVTPRAESAPLPHPLARELAAALCNESAPRVLLVGAGNGRNVPPFRALDIVVDVVEEDPVRARSVGDAFAADRGVRVGYAPHAGPYPFYDSCAGALSTSAMLHGSAASVARAIAAVRERLHPAGLFFSTFGSTRDPRFGCGLRVDDATFAPEAGSEAGVPHVYFDDARLRAVLEGFTILDASEASATETVGRWAHDARDAAAIVHWFVRARRE